MITVFKSYPKYKPSAVEFIGDIPVGWERKDFKFVFKYQTGGTPSSTDRSFYDGDFLWATISDLGTREINETKNTLNQKGVQEARIPLSPKGSLLISFKLSPGIVSFAGCDLYTNEAIATILPGQQDIYINYWYYVFQNYFVYNANENIYGAKLFNQRAIKNSVLVLPPLPEQQVIADFLDRETARIDAIVTKQRHLIELLKEKRSSLITQAVTKGLDPNAKMKPSRVEWIEMIPEGWEVRRWRFIANCNPTKGESNIREDLEVQFVPMELVPDEGYSLDLSETRKAHEVIKGYTYFLNGDVLIAKITPCFENGKGAIAENLTNGIGFGTTELHVYRAHKNKINSKYLFLISKLKAFRSLGEASMKGAAGQKRVTDLFIKDFIIPFPPLSEQKAITDCLDREMAKIDTLIGKIEKQIELLNEYRQSLITAVVTGKIDVREVVHAANS